MHVYSTEEGMTAKPNVTNDRFSPSASHLFLAQDEDAVEGAG